MAPVPGVTRAQVLALLASRPTAPLQLDLGSPHRDAVLRFDGHLWTLCPMIADPEAVRAAQVAAAASGRPFMPEHVVMLQRPGPPVLESSSVQRFAAAIAELPWGFGGPILG